MNFQRLLLSIITFQNKICKKYTIQEYFGFSEISLDLQIPPAQTINYFNLIPAFTKFGFKLVLRIVYAQRRNESIVVLQSTLNKFIESTES